MLNKHAQLIISAGGKLDNDFKEFVIKPGICITQISKPTEEFMNISKLMNLDDSRPEYEQHAELNSRITYMSFNDKKNSKEFNEKMVKKLQHLSVYNDHHVTFLLAGISLEACLELTAHNEATIARLTSSKTKAQSDPLFAVNSMNEMRYIDEVCNLRKQHLTGDLEQDNSLFPSRKAISMTMTMSLKNWHKTLIGRLSHNGVEKEVIKIMTEICNLLNERYPLVIDKAEEYFKLSNGAKYK